MDCQRFRFILDEYRSEQMEADERAAFAAHVEECVGCRAHLVSHEHMIRLIKDAYSSEQAAEIPERLAQRILAARRARRG